MVTPEAPDKVNQQTIRPLKAAAQVLRGTISTMSEIHLSQCGSPLAFSSDKIIAPLTNAAPDVLEYDPGLHKLQAAILEAPDTPVECQIIAYKACRTQSRMSHPGWNILHIQQHDVSACVGNNEQPESTTLRVDFVTELQSLLASTNYLTWDL